MLRVSAVWGTPLIVIVGGLFLWTALNSGTGHAFDIVTGTASPLTLHGGAAGVALAVVGYLLIPAFVGILVASVLTARAERVLRPRNEVEDEIDAGALRKAQVTGSTRGGREFVYETLPADVLDSNNLTPA